MPSNDPTRGSGPDKQTVAGEPGLDADPGALKNEPPGSNEPDPAQGGCLKLGWGCLPVVAFCLVAPASYFI
jgi:hypothetical protein